MGDQKDDDAAASVELSDDDLDQVVGGAGSGALLSRSQESQNKRPASFSRESAVKNPANIGDETGLP